MSVSLQCFSLCVGVLMYVQCIRCMYVLSLCCVYVHVHVCFVPITAYIWCVFIYISGMGPCTFKTTYSGKRDAHTWYIVCAGMLE